MDPKVVKILHDAFKKGMEEPSYVETIAKIDQEPFYLDTVDYRAGVKARVLRVWAATSCSLSHWRM